MSLAFKFSLDGHTYLVRPIEPDDKELLTEGFEHLSPESRYFRFLAFQSHLTEYQLKYFTEVDGINHIAWGILDVTSTKPIPVGVGRFIRLKDTQDVAEVAFTIVDAYQQKGLGGVLTAVLNLTAHRAGIKVFRYYILTENHFVVRNLELLGILDMEEDEGTLIIDAHVCKDHSDVPDEPELQSFAEVMKEVEEKFDED